jgi:tetratricopeptide (TPR) repeat protein
MAFSRRFQRIDMRTVKIFGVTFLLFASLAWSDEGHHHALTEEEIGSVHFPTSCIQAVESDINHAVALLHSFQYEDTRAAFEAVAVKDPTCAIAKWGVAMSHYHGLWGNGDIAAGRESLKRAQEIASANPATTAREHAYIDALAEIYQGQSTDASARDIAFESKMAALQGKYPDDTEAAVFHALALSITAPKTDRTFANQRKCGEILEPLLAKLPHHPGVAHYLIHCYDNPVLAEKALAAARTYAKIAPASAHANHMPSHIFTRVGSWDESIRSNRKSLQLAAHAEGMSMNGEARDQRLHAMDYLEYAYLQTGQVAQAKTVLAEMNSLKPVSGLTLTGDYALAAIPARTALELGNWEDAVGLQVHSEEVPWAQAITWVAIGIGGARAKHLDYAVHAEESLASLRDTIAKQNDEYWSKQVEVQRREVLAWIQQQTGKSKDAISTMRSAADLEESMDKTAVTPGAVLPAREMLAQLLVLANRPQEAVAEFEAVLKIAPNRFNALYGAATAAEAAGNAAVAQIYFRKLTEVAVGDERPELVAARKKIAITAKK